MINENKKGVRAPKRTVKPRNFVAKNMTASGAGAHKDKKKADKQGEVKHKKKELAETDERKLEIMLELSLLEAKISEIKKGQKDSNGYSSCWTGYHAAGTKKGKNGGRVRNCVPNEDVEESGGGQPAAIAIAKRESGKYTKDGKRKKNSEGWTHESLAAELFETPSYENHLREMLEGQVAFMEGGTEDGVTMFSKEPGHHRKEAGYDKGEYDEEGGMIKNDLHTIIRVSTHLERDIIDDENIPTWVIEKIAQTKGMIVSVMDYMISQHEMGVQPKQK